MSSYQETPIFTKTFDFLTWLLPATNNFPKAHRHTFTRRLLDAAFDLREYIEEANLRKGAARRERCCCLSSTFFDPGYIMQIFYVSQPELYGGAASLLCRGEKWPSLFLAALWAMVCSRAYNNSPAP